MSLKRLLIEASIRDKDTLQRIVKKWYVKAIKNMIYDFYGVKIDNESADDHIIRETQPTIFKEIVDGAFDADPTNGKYVMWILSTYLKPIIDTISDIHDIGTIKFRYKEDLPKVEEYLELFDKYKHKLNKKDINQYKSLDELFQAVSPFRYNEAGNFEEYMDTLKMGVDYSHHEHPDSEFDLYIPHTEKGACVLGTNTEWCTAWGQHSTNPKYVGRRSAFGSYDNLGIFIDKRDPDEKYQIDIESGQFMDVDDRSIDFTEVFDGDPLFVEFVESHIDEVKLNQYFEKKGDDIYIIAPEFLDDLTTPLDHPHEPSSVSAMLSTIMFNRLPLEVSKVFNGNVIDYLFHYHDGLQQTYPTLMDFINNVDKIRLDQFISQPISEFAKQLHHYNAQSESHHVFGLRPFVDLLEMVRIHINSKVQNTGYKIPNQNEYLEILMNLHQNYGQWDDRVYNINKNVLNSLIDVQKLSQEIKREYR